MVFYAGILSVLTILNLFRQYLTSLLYCFNAFFVKYLYKMSCTCSSTCRGWIQSHLPEASWKDNVEPESLVLAADSMVCVGGHGLPGNSACCLKVTLAAHEKQNWGERAAHLLPLWLQFLLQKGGFPATVCNVTHTRWLSAHEQGMASCSPELMVKGCSSTQFEQAVGFFAVTFK